MKVLEKHCKSTEDLILFTTPENIKKQAFELDENYMVALTKDNAKKACDCIENDPRYRNSSYNVYYKQLDKSILCYSLEEINEILEKIARSNSTRTSKKNMEVLSNYIFDNLQTFSSRLENGDINLVKELAECKGLDRREDSLASKICAYLCELEHNKSNYIINDNVVRAILPYYLCYYGIDTKLWKRGNTLRNLDKFSYEKIFDLIKQIQSKLPDPLTFSNIDNILWYCYKNDNVRTSIAQGIVLKDL